MACDSGRLASVSLVLIRISVILAIKMFSLTIGCCSSHFGLVNLFNGKKRPLTTRAVSTLSEEEQIRTAQIVKIYLRWWIRHLIWRDILILDQKPVIKMAVLHRRFDIPRFYVEYAIPGGTFFLRTYIS